MVMSAADLTIAKSAEGKAGEGLTGGSDCEGSGLAHLVSVALTLLIYRKWGALTKSCASASTGPPTPEGLGVRDLGRMRGGQREPERGTCAEPWRGLKPFHDLNR